MKLKRSDIKTTGLQPEKINALLGALMTPQYGMQAMMLLKNGAVVKEVYKKPYQKNTRRCMFSVTKTLTALAIGFLMQDGSISEEDLVMPFFKEQLPAAPMEYMQHLKIKHLLTMTSGVNAAQQDTARAHVDAVKIGFPYMYADFKINEQMNWAQDFLETYLTYPPGEKFVYDNNASHLLSAIVGKVTQKTMADYLAEKLFAPLGIPAPLWQTAPEGVTVGGYGVWLTLEELAGIGQFLLQKGHWQGKQILEKAYVEKMTSAQVEIGNRAAKWEKAFGYQVWILGEGQAYAGIGAFGQMYVVFPAQEMVFAMLGGSLHYMKVLDVLMRHIPNLEQQEGMAETKKLPKHWAEEIPAGASSWDMPQAMPLSNHTFSFSENLYGIEEMSFACGTEDTLRIKIKGEESIVPIGFGYWAEGKFPVQEDAETDVHHTPLFSAVAVSGAWAQDLFHIAVVFYETPYRMDLYCRFTPHGIKIEVKRNVSFVAAYETTLYGVRED
ncbi:MAG: serine hydrolase domain-containing protein [Christensenellaceae bacterium]|jgi:CubicO group peptidase (beta-lactamase class C family)